MCGISWQLVREPRQAPRGQQRVADIRADAAIEHPHLRVGHHERQSPEQQQDAPLAGGGPNSAARGWDSGFEQQVVERQRSLRPCAPRAVPETMRWWMAGRRKNAWRTMSRPRAQAKMRHSDRRTRSGRPPGAAQSRPTPRPSAQATTARGDERRQRGPTAAAVVARGSSTSAISCRCSLPARCRSSHRRSP